MQNAQQTLEVNVAVEDILAFNQYHHERSPYVSRQKMLMHVAGVAVFVLLAAVVWLSGHDIGFVVATLGGGVFFALIWRPWYRRYIDKATLKMYSEGANAGILGLQRLSLLDAGLAEQSRTSEAKHLWGGIERIESTDDHTFVYVGATVACIIPRNSVTSGHYETFVNALRSSYERHSRTGMVGAE